MRRIKLKCELYGDNLSPEKIKEKTSLVVSYNNTEKDSETANGAAIICLHEDLDEGGENELERLLDLLKENFPLLKEAGADVFVLHYDVVYNNQCNLEFDTEAIKKIADLGVTFKITCYQDYSQFREEDRYS